MSLILEHRNKKANDIHEGKWNSLGGKFEYEEDKMCSYDAVFHS